MVRETARSKVIGYSYRDFSSPPNMGTQFLATTKRPFAKSWSVFADTLESMCGRYATSASPQDLMEEFEVDDLFDGLPGPDYNVAPTVAVPAIFERRVRDSGEIRRRLAPLIWGLVPSWAKEASIGSRMINARLETVAEKPAFRRAFSARRCLLPADGFYEWYAAESPA
ncbi:MAG TPA: SOS response-associated peptidase, partial [Propionibacteriaceae bacterium]|nr:SOS response-associated peptidase [Propionibacteriaceae bacterium]